MALKPTNGVAVELDAERSPKRRRVDADGAFNTNEPSHSLVESIGNLAPIIADAVD